ncbi:MAG: PKD domain-containing protein [Bacteroidota bacterium]|nr:PKD domain-containing protein [Bacteroidota bacterium]
MMNALSKKLSLFIICLFSFSLNFASGHLHHHDDSLSKTFISNPKQLRDPVIQQSLMQQRPWANFSRNNTSWKVIFDENSNMPHRAYGAPVAVPGYDAKSTAENFITNQLSEFRVPFSDLRFRSVSTNAKYHYVNFVQLFQGLEVLYSNIQIKMTHDYRVNQFALDCYPGMSVGLTPAINPATAIQFASNEVSGIQQVTVTPELKVLPVPGNRIYTYHLVYEIMVENLDHEGIPGKYYTLVDAADGKILYRANMVNHVAANTDVNVTGTLHLTNPYNPASVAPMKNMRVVEGGNIYFTDDTGYVALSNTSATTATFSLQGRWVRIRTNNVTPTWTVNLNPGSNNINIDSSGSDIKQRSTFDAINTVHEYMKSKFPLFTGLDFPLPANIDVAGNCNAFYNGSSVNFFDVGGGCNATSLVADIGFHEYGHAINDKFYQSISFQWQNGAMGEGYADLWALGITGSSVLGVGFFDSNLSGIRRYDINKKVYPQDLVGQVHADGEIIAGCFWDTGLNLGNLQQMMDLFKETYYAGITGPNGSEGSLYADILLETLAQDDNDGDITNGTPNYCAIIAAFEIHGITLGPTFVPCAPVALFSYQPGSICESVNVTFTDESFFADSWDWSFPGGTPSVSTDENPEITYNVAGVYDVTLTITNAAGTNSLTKTGAINVLPAAGQYAVPFTESFEAITFPGTEWPVENSSGNTWTQNSIAAKTGSNSIYINNFSGNTSGTSDVFLTPSYDLSQSTSNTMTFELAYALTSATSEDKLKVYASTTCGQLWNLRYTKYGTNLATAGVVTTQFVPLASEWLTQTVNIASVSYNNKPNVRFKFEYAHKSGNDIFIDDINVTGTVGLQDNPEESFNFNVYPNPASSGATISFTLEGSHKIHIDVVDVLGREENKIAETFLNPGDYQFELPAELANGLYTVRIIFDGNILIRKVLINKL